MEGRWTCRNRWGGGGDGGTGSHGGRDAQAYSSLFWLGAGKETQEGSNKVGCLLYVVLRYMKETGFCRPGTSDAGGKQKRFNTLTRRRVISDGGEMNEALMNTEAGAALGEKV